MSAAVTLLARVRRARADLRGDAPVDREGITTLLDDVAASIELRDDVVQAAAPLVWGGERHDGLLGTAAWLARGRGYESTAAVYDEHRRQLEAAVERAARGAFR